MDAEKNEIRKKIYIVGAHSRGQTLAEYVRCLFPDTEVEAYLYDNDEKNPKEIDKTPVLRLDKEMKLNPDYPVLIGTRSVHHEKIIQQLKIKGIEKIYPVTPELDMKLRNAYVRKYYADKGRNFWKINELESNKKCKTKPKKKESKVYVVRSVFDQQLQYDYHLASYEKDIQAGAALTPVRLYEGILTDDKGENISVKNSQYCELTVLYWIWKHAEEKIVGLAHYRRHFILPAQWMEVMQEYHIDVVLPVPLYVAPNIEENYKKRHDASDWDFMMQCLKEQSIDTYNMAQKFFKNSMYSPCNMFIMKKEILEELCTWLFPILEMVTAHSEKKEDKYQNRYPGFLAERLMTFYLETKKEYKIVYADKSFLI